MKVTSRSRLLQGHGTNHSGLSIVAVTEETKLRENHVIFVGNEKTASIRG